MTTLTFKAAPVDAIAFRAAAKEKRVSFSTYVRDTLRAAAKKSPRNYKKDDLTPGRVIIDGPPVTTEQIHAALYDEIPG
jgi:hypothetical protein